ncbi:MAG: ParB N-terminal domain-containing protein, partial [Spirochaetota bacterium]
MSGKTPTSPGFSSDVTWAPIDSLQPAPQNEKIYRSTDHSDPEIRKLARSIREHGILEPIVESLDGYIISGHRRYSAARLARLRFVPVRFFPIESTDENFEEILVSFNDQRTKSIDEVIREQIVKIDPAVAREKLVEYRRKRAEVNTDTIDLGSKKKRHKVSEGKQAMLSAIIAAVEAERDFWPITARQVHYWLLNNPPLRHTKKPDSKYINDKY